MKKYLILGAVVLTLGMLINYSLGGFEGIKPKLIKVNNYTVYGHNFEGSYKSSQLTDLVDEMRGVQQTLEHPSDLVIINYINEAKETLGKINNFVGLRLSTTSDDQYLSAFDKRVIEANRSIRIEIKIKPLVMPSPEKINEVAFAFAKSNGFAIQELSIEQYSQNGVLIIEYPVQAMVPTE